LTDPRGLNPRPIAYPGDITPIPGAAIWGNTIFDALFGAPGTSLSFDIYGNLSWDFSPDLWRAYYAAQTSVEYKFSGITNPSKQEQQKELAAIQLGKAVCDGQDPSAIAGCIEDAYNTMRDLPDCGMEGGNCNFSYTDVVIQNVPFDPASL